MNNYTILNYSLTLKKLTQRITFSIRKVLFTKQRIAERQPRRNPPFLHQRQHFLLVTITESHSTATPDAICRSSINGTNLTPIIKPVTICAV